MKVDTVIGLLKPLGLAVCLGVAGSGSMAAVVSTSEDSSLTPPDSDISVSYPRSATKSWQLKFPRRVVFQQLLNDGRLLVASDSGECDLVDSRSGEVIWEATRLGSMEAASFVAIPNSTVGCLMQYRVHTEEKFHPHRTLRTYYNTCVAIEMTTGRTLWNSGQLGYHSIHGVVPLSSVDGILFYGRDSKKKRWFSAANIHSGEQMWKSDSLFGKDGPSLTGDIQKEEKLLAGVQSPLFDTDTTAIFFWDDGAIRRVDLRNGQLLFCTRAKWGSTPALRKGYAQGELSRDRTTALFPVDERLAAFSVQNGALVWEARLPGRVYQFQQIRNNCLVLGGPHPEQSGGQDYLTLLDLTTGKRVWEEDLHALDHRFTSNFVVIDSLVYVYSKGKLWSAQLGTGTFKKLANSIHFDRREFSPSMELIDSLLILSTNNCLAGIALDGRQVYEKHYSAPGDDISFLEAVGIAGLFVVGELLTQNVWAPGPSWPGESDTLISSRRAQEYTYIVSSVRDNVGKKPGVLKVNRSTGEAVAGVKLDDRQPWFLVDDRSGRLYYLRDGHTLECYEF